MKRLAFLGACSALAVFAACEETSSDPPSTEIDGGSLAIDASRGDSAVVVVEAGSDGAAPDAADGGSDATVDAPGSPGALVFDGVDDQVVFELGDGGANETAFTAEVWFKTTTTLGNMFEIFNPGGGSDRFLYTQSGRVCFYVYGPPTTVCSSGDGNFADGAWHHAAGTLGTVGGQKVYVDGNVEGTLATTTKSTFTSDKQLSVGRGHYAFNSAIVSFAGQIDEVRVWSVERSASEIQANFRRTIAPSTAGLQGYWRFDETGSTATARDETAAGHAGTLSGFTFTTSPWVGPGAF